MIVHVEICMHIRSPFDLCRGASAWLHVHVVESTTSLWTPSCLILRMKIA